MQTTGGKSKKERRVIQVPDEKRKIGEELKTVVCFNCRKLGHYSSHYMEPPANEEEVAQQHTQFMMEENVSNSSKNPCVDDDMDSALSSEIREDNDNFHREMYSATSFETHQSFKHVCFEDRRLLPMLKINQSELVKENTKENGLH